MINIVKGDRAITYTEEKKLYPSAGSRTVFICSLGGR